MTRTSGATTEGAPGPDSPRAGGSPPRRRVRHPARWIAGIVVALLVVGAVVLVTRPSSQATNIQSPLLGQRAPDFTRTAFSGQQIALSHYRGRYVLVNFFASWCPPCQEEEPNLIRFAFQQSRQAHGAALVSVVFNDPDQAARQFVATWGATWPTVPDPGGVIASDYGVTGPPTTFLIAPSGRVVGEESGPVTVPQLDQLLAAARRHAL